MRRVNIIWSLLVRHSQPRLTSQGQSISSSPNCRHSRYMSIFISGFLPSSEAFAPAGNLTSSRDAPARLRPSYRGDPTTLSLRWVDSRDLAGSDEGQRCKKFCRLQYPRGIPKPFGAKHSVSLHAEHRMFID